MGYKQKWNKDKKPQETSYYSHPEELGRNYENYNFTEAIEACIMQDVINSDALATDINRYVMRGQ
jgi:hypothetical protein